MTLLDPRLLIAGALLSAGAGGLTGWKLRDAGYQRHLKEDAKKSLDVAQKARSIEKVLVGVSADTRDRVDAKEASVRVITKTITERVPYYVTSTPQEKAVVAAGGLPLGFVQLYNAAVLGVDPSASPQAGAQSGDPSGVDLSTLARINTGNLGLYHQCRARLEEWDKAWDEITAMWPKQQEQSK